MLHGRRRGCPSQRTWSATGWGRGGVVVVRRRRPGPAPPPFAWLLVRALRSTAVVAPTRLGMPPPAPVPPAPPARHVVVDQAVADGDDARVQLPVEVGVEVPQEVEEAAPGRVAVAAAGLIMAFTTLPGADAGHAPGVVGDGGADAGANQARHTGGAGVVVAALCVILGQDAVADGDRVWPRRGPRRSLETIPPPRPSPTRTAGHAVPVLPLPPTAWLWSRVLPERITTPPTSL